MRASLTTLDWSSEGAMECNLEISFEIGLLETVLWSLGYWCLSAPSLGDLIVLSRGELLSSTTGDWLDFSRDSCRWVSQSSLGVCQDMLFFNFYFDQFYAHSLNTFPFYVTDVFLMTLRFLHSRTERVYIGNANYE